MSGLFDGTDRKKVECLAELSALHGFNLPVTYSS